ncbi:unnamed protein product [Mytilus coruscus]|uniref:Uncharacterized protein n=1 Tax=Mytilus coruscus TaxID=42192 RepID=A0A6J8EX48_MYTCO|nr:unnamed protein product [Mytilus coruscus]
MRRFVVVCHFSIVGKIEKKNERWEEKIRNSTQISKYDDRIVPERRNEVSRRLRPRVNNVGVQRPAPHEAPAPEKVPVPEEVVRVVNRVRHGKRRRAAPELQQADQPVEPNNQPPPQKQLKTTAVQAQPDAPFDRVYPYDRKFRLSVSLKHSKSLSAIDGFLWLKFIVKGSQGTPNPVVCQANLQRPCYDYNFKGYCHKSQCFTDITV